MTVPITRSKPKWAPRLVSLTPWLGLGLLLLVGSMIGVGVWITRSSARGIAEIASDVPAMLLAVDSAATQRLPDGTAVVFDGARVGTLKSMRRFGREPNTLTIYSGTWDSVSLRRTLREDTTLMGVVDSESGPGQPLTIRLVPRPQGDGRSPRGLVWLEPAPGAFGIF